MTLQLQDSQSEELKSLTLLDGSHTWVSTLMDSINTHKDHPEIQAVNYVFGGMGLDILVGGMKKETGFNVSIFVNFKLTHCF